MLKWKKPLYIGSGIKNPEKIRAKIENGKLVPGIYLITLSETPGNLMELLPAVSLKQTWMRELCPEIIGIAKGKDGAIELTEEILLEVNRRTGSFRIKEYMENR